MMLCIYCLFPENRKRQFFGTICCESSAFFYFYPNDRLISLNILPSSVTPAHQCHRLHLSGVFFDLWRLNLSVHSDLGHSSHHFVLEVISSEFHVNHFELIPCVVSVE